jgi:hypothetical protein
MQATAKEPSPNVASLHSLEQADQQARPQTTLLPDILVFDTDSKRMGEYGGFFLAHDYNADSYQVTGASNDPKAQERVNSPTSRIRGIHLPNLAHFALVAAGPLYTINDIFHFEAIVFCKEIVRRDTGQVALLKLTTKGPAAVKLHHFFTIGISDPLTRMTVHYHSLARELFTNQEITKDRLDNILRQQATPQMLWIPVELQRGVQIGRDTEKSVIGTMVYTDEPIPNTKKFNSRWSGIPLEQLITPDSDGGLLLTGNTQQHCRTHRQYYEEILTTRALAKGIIQQTPVPKDQTSSSFPPSSQQPSATTERAPLLHEIRAQLTAIGKSETAADVTARMSKFGAPTLEGMRETQLQAFSAYVQSYAHLRGMQKTQATAIAR